MTNIGYTGLPRHGKTLKLVDLTKKCYDQGYKIVSAMTSLDPIKIPFIPFDPNTVLDAYERKISIQEAFGLPPKAYVFLNLDEITTLGGYNRLSLSQLNIILTFLFMQAGKRRFSVGWTAQLWDSVDKNLKPLTQLQINVQRVGPDRNPSFFILEFTFHNSNRSPFKMGWYAKDFRPAMQLYDTEEPMHPQFISKRGK